MGKRGVTLYKSLSCTEIQPTHFSQAGLLPLEVINHQFYKIARLTTLGKTAQEHFDRLVMFAFQAQEWETPRSKSQRKNRSWEASHRTPACQTHRHIGDDI